MLLEELRAEVARYAKKLAESRLVRATQGNLSARDTACGLICLTPSGMDYDLLTAEDIVVVDEAGAIVEGERKPSTELPLHTLILRRRRDVHCVMHTHSPYATAFGVVYQPLPIVLAESALCLNCPSGEVPIAPYQMSGTPEFAELIAETLGAGNAVIWGNHGAMVVGPTLALTYSAAHALEDGAQVYLLARRLGTPVPLPEAEIAKLHAFWRENYSQDSSRESACAGPNPDEA
jgi:ribulose-5-phosphate 4-epimerase/fuculose-1-phosphate aldolase